MRISPHGTILKGFAWKQSICIHGTHYLASAGDPLSRRAVGDAGD